MALQDYIEEEGNLELQKKRQDETNERKNAVEAYVYMLRSQLSDALASVRQRVRSRASISSKLTDTEVGCFAVHRESCDVWWFATWPAGLFR